jgi:hypothetical protein
MDDYNFLDELFDIINEQPFTTSRFSEFEETIQLNQQIINNIYNIRRHLEYSDYDTSPFRQDESPTDSSGIVNDIYPLNYENNIDNFNNNFNIDTFNNNFNIDTFNNNFNIDTFNNNFNIDTFNNNFNIDTFNNNFINDLFNIFNQTINENIEQEFEDVKVTLTPEQFSQLKCEKISNDNVDRYCNKPCNICMDNYNVDEEITFLVCNHYFHTDCIKHWLCNEKVTCPVCRKDNR